jgi:hypothetical protein
MTPEEKRRRDAKASATGSAGLSPPVNRRLSDPVSERLSPRFLGRHPYANSDGTRLRSMKSQFAQGGASEMLFANRVLR